LRERNVTPLRVSLSAKKEKIYQYLTDSIGSQMLEALEKPVVDLQGNFSQYWPQRYEAYVIADEQHLVLEAFSVIGDMAGAQALRSCYRSIGHDSLSSQAQ